MRALKKQIPPDPGLMLEYNQSHKFSAPRDVQEMLSECDLLIADLNAVEHDFSQYLLESYFRRIFALYKRVRAKTL